MTKQDKINQLEHELEVESQDSMMKSINKDWKHTSDSKQLEEQREEQMENKILIDCFNPNEQTLDMPKLLNLITDAINQAVDDEQKRMTEVMLNNSKPFFDSGYEQADKKWRRRAELLIQAVKGKSLWERSYVESLATLLEEV